MLDELHAAVQDIASSLGGDRRECLRPDPDHDPLAVVVGDLPGPHVVPRQIQGLLSKVERDIAVEVHVDRCLDQVHPRTAEERRHEQGARSSVDLGRRADVLQDALAQDRHAVGHRERLGLVVRHVHGGHAKLPDEGGDLRAQLGP